MNYAAAILRQKSSRYAFDGRIHWSEVKLKIRRRLISFAHLQFSESSQGSSSCLFLLIAESLNVQHVMFQIAFLFDVTLCAVKSSPTSNDSVNELPLNVTRRFSNSLYNRLIMSKYSRHNLKLYRSYKRDSIICYVVEVRYSRNSRKEYKLHHTLDPLTAMSNSHIIATVLTALSCPYRVCKGCLTMSVAVPALCCIRQIRHLASYDPDIK